VMLLLGEHVTADRSSRVSVPALAAKEMLAAGPQA